MRSSVNLQNGKPNCDHLCCGWSAVSVAHERTDAQAAAFSSRGTQTDRQTGARTRRARMAAAAERSQSLCVRMSEQQGQGTASAAAASSFFSPDHTVTHTERAECNERRREVRNRSRERPPSLGLLLVQLLLSAPFVLSLFRSPQFDSTVDVDAVACRLHPPHRSRRRSFRFRRVEELAVLVGRPLRLLVRLLFVHKLYIVRGIT